MKGGDVLALGVLRALVPLPAHYAEVALLLVNDEEWRVGAAARTRPTFAGWDACLCFEAGQTGADGDDEVIVKRKAAATLRVEAHGAARRTRARRPTRAQRAAGARRRGAGGGAAATTRAGPSG